MPQLNHHSLEVRRGQIIPDQDHHPDHDQEIETR